MNIFTNDDYRRIQAWLKANAIKDSDFTISEDTVPDEDILVITQNMSTVPTNYKIKIKDLLNSSLGKVVINKITANIVKVNNSLTVDASKVILNNEKGTTLQDVFNYFEEGKLNRHTDDTFDGNLTVKKNITIEGNIKSHDDTITVEADLEATGEITDGQGNMLSDVNEASKGWKIEYQDPQQDEPTVRAKYVLKDYRGVPKGNIIKIYKDSAITNVYLGTVEDTCNLNTGEVTKHPIHDNNEALSIVYRLDTGKYSLVNVPIKMFVTEAEFDKYRGLGITENGQVFIKLASDIESSNYLHFNELGEITADGIETRILKDLGNIITSVAGDRTMWGQYKKEEGTKDSPINEASRWGQYKQAETDRNERLNNLENQIEEEKVAIIRTNRIADEAVTISKLSSDIQAFISNLSKNALFAGIAVPTTNPDTPEGPVFYFATQIGTYSNFNGIEVTKNEVVILYYDTTWHKIVTDIASNHQLIELISKINEDASKIIDEKVLSSNYYIYSSKFKVKEGIKYTIRVKIPNYKSGIHDNIKLRTSSGDITPELKLGVKSFDDYFDFDLIPTVTSNNAYVALYGSNITPGNYEAEIIIFDNSIDLYWHGENIRFNTKEINENKIRLTATETRLDSLEDAESLQKNEIKFIDYGEWVPKKDNSGATIVQGYTNYVFNVEGLSCIFVDAIIGGTSELATISTAPSNKKDALIRIIKTGTGNNEHVSKKIVLESNEKVLYVVCPNGHIPLVKETYEQKEINQTVVKFKENFGEIYTKYEFIGKETYMLYIYNIPVQKNTTYKISLKSNVDFTFGPNGNLKFIYSNKENGLEQSLAKINISNWVSVTLESKYDDNVTLALYNNSIFSNDIIIDVKFAEENVPKYISSLLLKVPQQELELNNIKKHSIGGVGHYEGENNFRFPNEYSYKKILEYKDSSLNNSSWAGGMALYDKYAVVLYNGGYMAMFDIYNKELLAYGATSTNSADNHYNCGIFTNQIMEDDLLPIIYTSKCKTGSSDCYVERIKIDGKHLTTELLQTITCSSNIMPSDKDCDWLIDKKTNSLVMLYSARNAVKAVYFNMPNLDIINVELTSSDIIEEIVVFDNYITARQGSFVYDKMLYYAQGTDRQQIAVIDLNTKSIVTKINLSPLTTGEIEAVYVYGKKIYANAHTDNGLEIKLYELNF